MDAHGLASPVGDGINVYWCATPGRLHGAWVARFGLVSDRLAGSLDGLRGPRTVRTGAEMSRVKMMCCPEVGWGPLPRHGPSGSDLRPLLVSV